jgi:hypothetical protein
MPRNKFQATDWRGQVHTRTSNDRTYTHCVVVHFAATQTRPARNRAEWAGNAYLAEKNAASWRKAAAQRSDIEEVEILAAGRR